MVLHAKNDSLLAIVESRCNQEHPPNEMLLTLYVDISVPRDRDLSYPTNLGLCNARESQNSVQNHNVYPAVTSYEDGRRFNPVLVGLLVL